MLRVVTSRLASAFVAVIGASLISFALLRLAAGNPARLVLGPFATPQQLNAFGRQLGLDQPLWVQYWRYLSAFVRGDWGYSFGNGQDVTTLMGNRLPASLELGLFAFVLALVLAVALALLATYRRRPIADGTVRALSWLGLGMPPFWLGLLLLLLFFQVLGWLPGPEGRLGVGTVPPPAVTHFYTVDALLAGQWSTFWDAYKHLLLPAVALGFAPFAFLVRLLRVNLLEVRQEPFLVVVRSKGIGRFETFARHALPNAFLPTLTAAGLILAQLVAGSLLVEKVFDWPGVGDLVVNAILRRDYAVVQTFILLSATVYVIVNAAVDVLYGVIDPRVRISSQQG